MNETRKSGLVGMAEAIEGLYCRWDDENYDTLIDAIREGNCILMLGPDASMVVDNGKPRPLSEILANKLAEKISPEIKTHIDTSSLTQVSQYYGKEYGKKDLLSQVKRFYRARQEVIPSLYNDLAALTFHLIINSTHDNMFFEALSNQNKPPHEGWYNFKKSPQGEVDMGNKQNPLVFYLYGHLNEEESLLLTESDLLDFLKTLIKGKPGLQDYIRSELQGEDKVFLFFGFGFRHWYLRLLLHVLRECQESSRSFAIEQYESENISRLQLQETVFFFKKSDCKIHIFKEDFQQIAGKLRQKFEKPNPQCMARVEKKKAPEVFICHAHEDKKYAVDLYEKFDAAGLRPWLDNKNIEPGDKWEECIEESINKVDYFVVLLSEALNNGRQRFAIREIELAIVRGEESKREKFFIFPILIEKCSILEKLKDIHAMDVTVETDITPLINIIKRDFAKRLKQ